MSNVNVKDFAKEAFDSYQRIGRFVSGAYAAFPSLNLDEAKKEMQDTVLALLASIIATDGKVKQSESDFMNAFLSTQNSLAENEEVVSSYLPKSPTLLSRVPNFFRQVAELDKAADSRFAALLLGNFEIIGSYASLADGEQHSREQEALASYLARLDCFLAEEGVQLAGLSPGKRHTGKERNQATRDYGAAIRSKLDKKPENERASVLTSEDKEPQKQTACETPEKTARSFEQVMADLDRLIGLKTVKQEVRTLASLIKIRKQRASMGLPNPVMSWHLVFSGNPGTGKTTVARLLSEIYRALGFLAKGHLLETDRSGLVGGYMGQTAIKVKGVVTSAFGGLLFIDEAYRGCSES